MVGSGRTELLKVLFGALPHSRGKIIWNAKPFVPKSPSHAIANRVVMVPEAGHYPQSQRPGITTGTILCFLDSVTGRA